jgi:thioredoxin-related protein
MNKQSPQQQQQQQQQGRTMPAPIPKLDGLEKQIERAAKQKRPLVLLVTMPGCAWCDLVKQDYLQHLARDQDKEGVFVFETIQGGIELQRYRITMVPTVLFLGPQGEIAERLIGYGSRDFYGAYLTERINSARKKLS